MLKRCLSLILAFVMVFSLLPVQALAEGAPEAEGDVLIQETLAPEADPEPETDPVPEETEPATEKPTEDPAVVPAADDDGSQTACAHKWNEEARNGLCLTCGAVCKHDGETHVETIPATCKEVGYELVVCDICTASIEGTELPIAEHVYVDGVCECGEKEPAYDVNTVASAGIPTLTVEDLQSGDLNKEIGFAQCANGVRHTFHFSDAVLSLTETEYGYIIHVDATNVIQSSVLDEISTGCTAHTRNTSAGVAPNTFEVTAEWRSDLETWLFTGANQLVLIYDCTKTETACQHATHTIHGSCSNCGELVDHVYEDGTCSVCGRINCGHSTFEWMSNHFECSESDCYACLTENCWHELDKLNLIALRCSKTGTTEWITGWNIKTVTNIVGTHATGITCDGILSAFQIYMLTGQNVMQGFNEKDGYIHTSFSGIPEGDLTIKLTWNAESQEWTCEPLEYFCTCEGGTPVTYAAEIGTTRYVTAQRAISFASAHDTVKLIAECADVLNFSNKNIVLDLNGYNVTNGIDVFCSTVKLRGEGEVYGDVSIMDPSEGEDPSNVTIESGTYKGSFSIDSGCTLTITGGTFAQDVSIYVAEGSVCTNNGDGTWTVVTETVNSVTFTFSLLGDEANMEPVTVRIGEELVLPECTAENPGFVFSGWDIGRSDRTWLSVGGAFSETGTREYKPGDRILITADLFDDETYDYHIGSIWRKVSGDIQMYFHVQDQPIVKTVTLGETFTMPACDIEVPGYRFEYWYMQREDGMVLNADGDFVENFNADHRPFLPGDEIDTSEPVFSFAEYFYYFVAKLARDDGDETYITLTFNEGVNTMMSGRPVKAGDTFTIPGNQYENPGHEFVGWFLSCRGGAWMAADNSFTTDESVSSRLFVPGDEFTVTEEILNLTDPVFHAIWKDAITIKNNIADTYSTVKYGDLYQFPESDGQILYWAIQRSDETILYADGTFHEDTGPSQWQLYEPSTSIVIDADLFDGSKYTYTLCYISDGNGGTNEGSSAWVSDETGLNNAIEAWFNDIYIEEDITLTDVLTIPEGISLYIESGATLTVPADQTLTIEGNLFIDGTVKVAPGACICTADQDGTWIGVWSGTLDVTGADISGFDLDRADVDFSNGGQILGIPTTSIKGRFEIHNFDELKAAILQAPLYKHLDFNVHGTVTVTKDLEIPANVSMILWSSYGPNETLELAKLTIASDVNMVHNGNLQVGDDAILNVAEDAQFTVRGYFSVNSTAKIINNGTISYTRNKYYFDPGHIYEGTGKMNIIKAPGLTESQLHDALLNSDEYHIYLTDDITLTKNLSITENHAVHVEEGATLTVPAGKTLTIEGDLYIDGTVKVVPGGRMILVDNNWACLGVSSGTLDVTGADISGLDFERITIDLSSGGQVLGVPTTSLHGRFEIYDFEDLKAAALQAPQYQHVGFNIHETVTVTTNLEIPANVSITIWGYGDTPAELAIASGVNMVHNGNLQVGDNAILNVAENAQLTVFDNLYANSTAKIVNYGTIYYAYFNYDDGYSYEGSGQMIRQKAPGMTEEQLRAALEGEYTWISFDGNITLTRDLEIPQNYTICMEDDASITVPAGISLIVEGGLDIINGTVTVNPGASFVTIDNNHLWISVGQNGHLDLTGADLTNADISRINLNLAGSGTISGVPSTAYQASARVETLDGVRTYLAMASQYYHLSVSLVGNVTVTEDLKIPGKAGLQIEWDWKWDNNTDTEYKVFGSITVAPGVKLENRGHIYVGEGSTLTVSEGSELYCIGSMYIGSGGTLINDGIIYERNISAESGAIILGNGKRLPYEAPPMTEDELHEELLNNDGYLQLTGDLTLTRDLTISENDGLELVKGAVLTVPADITLTIDGYLQIGNGTLKVEKDGILKVTSSGKPQIGVFDNGVLDATGADISGVNGGTVYFWLPNPGNIHGIPAEKLAAAGEITSYTSLVNTLAEANKYHTVYAEFRKSMTISKDVEIPENVIVEISASFSSSGKVTPTKITVSSGASIFNDGAIYLYDSTTLTINSGCELYNGAGVLDVGYGATLVNNGTVTSSFDSFIINNEAIVKGTGKFRIIEALVGISSVDKIMEAYANGATVLRIVNSPNFVFTEDTTLPKDLELEFISSNVTIAEGVTVTCETNRALSFTSNSTLYLNGAVDAKEIFIDNGSAVVPEEKIISKVKAPVGGWYIKLGIPKVESLTIWEIVEGETIEPVLDVDMKYKPKRTAQLSITSEPQYSSQIVTWKTSSAAIATVNADGLVTFKKPGTVTITATAADGSKVSTSVKFNVTYLDPATKLTAVAEVPELGLEESYTTTMLVYGTDKENALNPLDLTFTSSNNAIATVDGNGTITAGKNAGTATITAAITGDPLGRKVSVKVKVIPLQTEILYLLPQVNPSDLVNLNPGSDEPPKFEFYLDKSHVASGEYTLQVKPVAFSTNGNGERVTMDLTASSLKWVSTDTKVAAVKANSDGSATVTLKADGATAITATTTDLAALSWEFFVYVCDKSPRLDTKTVTLNTKMETGVSIPLVESYDNTITGVTVDDERLAVSHDDGMLTITAPAFIDMKGTIKTKLNVETNEGLYTYDFSVKIANSEPSITVKQPVKFNIYTGLGTDLTFTAKNAEIDRVELVEGTTTSFDQVGDPETGILLLEASDAHLNGTAAMDAKIEVDVYLEGYREPIRKAVTVATSSTKPSITVKQAEKINLFYTTGETTLEITAKDMEFYRVLLVDTTSFAGAFVTGTHFMDISRVYSGETKADTSAKLLVYPVGYETPIEKAITIKTVTTKPSLSLTPASSTINTKLESKTTFISVYDKATGGIVLKPEDVEEVTVTNNFATYAVTEDGGILLELTGDKGGTATIEVKLPEWTQSIKLTHKVTVKDTMPAPVLGTSTLKLNRIFTKATAETTATLNQSNYDIYDIEFTPVSSGAENIKVDYDTETGIITAFFKDTAADKAPKNGNYKFDYVVILGNKDHTELAKKTITVNVSSTVPTAKLKTSTLTLNKNLGALAAAQTTVSLTKGDGYKLIGMNYTGDISEDIEVKFDAATGTVSAYLMNEAAAAKSHTIYLHPVLWNEAAEQEVTLSSTVKLTVAVKAQTISASISTKGKLDTMDPGSAITYTINKLNNIVGEVYDADLVDGMGLFDVKLDTTGSKPVVILTRLPGAVVDTKTTYKLQLQLFVQTNSGSYTVTTKISFKVSQSALKFVTIPTQKLYLFQKELVTTVALNTPVTATLGNITLNSKTAAAFKKAMGDGMVTFELIDGGRSAEVHFAIEHPGYLVNGKSYTVYLDITPADNATNVKPTQLKLTVKAYK